MVRWALCIYMLCIHSTRFIIAQISFTDHITSIETLNDKIIITTNKMGSADNLKIKIDLIDILETKKFAIFDLSGPLLVISRGRYTINFLNSNRWYGILYRSENVIDGVTHMNLEEKLTRTLPANSTHMDLGALVFIHRDGTSGYHLEDVLVTAKWLDEMTRQILNEISINVALICGKQMRRKVFKLDKATPRITEIFQIDYNSSYEESEMEQSVKAILSPKSCNKMCWTSTIVANAYGNQFVYENETICETISTVNATSKLRRYYDFEVIDGNLHVYTTYGRGNREAEPDDAMIEINGFDLSKNFSLYEDGHLTANYSVHGHEDTFVLKHLLPDRWYGVYFEYTKKSPFLYHREERFVVESPKVNGSQSEQRPVRSEFPEKIVDEKTGNFITDKSTYVQMIRDQQYEGYDVDVSMILPCDTSKEEFLLNDEYPVHSVDIQLARVLCSFNSTISFCEKILSNETKCTLQLCYRFSIRVFNEIFVSKQYCDEISDKYRELPAIHSAGLYSYHYLLSVILVTLIFAQQVFVYL